MVSIRQSLTELEAAYRIRMAALECYRSAVQSAGQYAVDFETSVAEKHRQELDALAVEIAGTQTEPALSATLARFRAAIRDYRDRGAAFLGNLRRELAEKAAGLEQIFHSLLEGDGEHELRISRTIRGLQELAARPEAAAVRGPLADAANTLDESLQEMKRQHQLTVAQFLMEIRLLHSRIQELETPSSQDEGGLCTRQQLEARMDEAVAAGEPFFLLMLRVRNLTGVLRQFPGVEQELLSAFSKRVRNCVKPDDAIGRWNENCFAVLECGSKSESLGAVRRLAEHAGGAYVIKLGDRLARPTLQINVGAVEAHAGGTRPQLVARAEQFLAAMI